VLPICNIRITTEKPCYLPYPEKDDKTLGAELKRRRLALKWTQQETVTRFNVRKDCYQKWEWNEIVPSIKRQKEVIQFLGFNFWDDGSNSIANRLLLYRIEHGLYRIELAEMIKVSDSTIERIEKDNSRNSKQMIQIVETCLK